MFLYAYLCFQADRLYDAEYLIEGALEDTAFVEQYPGVLYYAARIFAGRGQYPRAIDVLEPFLDAMTATRAGTTSTATVSLPE